MFVSVAEFGQRNGWAYAKAWREINRGAVPGVVRLSGKLFVEVPDVLTTAGAMSPEVNRLQQLTADLERHPLQLVATRGL